ncbi:Uncharacterized protein Rs2_35314 [Raphanus sativus]|nr:Uncharacterized protein Rs2_35314 [Raphanus sativus]
MIQEKAFLIFDDTKNTATAAVEVDRLDQHSQIKEITFKKQTELEDIRSRTRRNKPLISSHIRALPTNNDGLTTFSQPSDVTRHHHNHRSSQPSPSDTTITMGWRKQGVRRRPSEVVEQRKYIELGDAEKEEDATVGL